MAMGTVTATNVATGAVEEVKYIETKTMSEIYSAATTTALAITDTIVGPSLPAGTFLWDVVVDWTDVDSAASFTWTAGISGTLAKFISTSTVGQAAGIAHMNVGGNLGYSPAADTPVLVTITATAGTPVAGTCRISLIYTASP